MQPPAATKLFAALCRLPNRPEVMHTNSLKCIETQCSSLQEDKQDILSVFADPRRTAEGTSSFDILLIVIELSV